MQRVRSLLVLALVSTLIALGLVAASPAVALGNPAPQLAPICSAFDDPIYTDLRRDASARWRRSPVLARSRSVASPTAGKSPRGK